MQSTEVEKNISESVTIFRILRTLSGLSGKRFASICDISYPYWHQLETGEKNNPSRTVINKIANACGLHPETLWYLAGKDHPKTKDVQKIIMESLENYVSNM